MFSSLCHLWMRSTRAKQAKSLFHPKSCAGFHMYLSPPHLQVLNPSVLWVSAFFRLNHKGSRGCWKRSFVFMPLCLVLHDICIVPGCGCNHSCLSSLLCLRPSFPCYPKAPQVQDVLSPPLLPRVASPGLCRNKAFLPVVFVCVSGWADSPGAAAAAARALPWGMFPRGGGWQQAPFPKAVPHKGFQEIWKPLIFFCQAPSPLIRSLCCILGKYCNGSACSEKSFLLMKKERMCMEKIRPWRKNRSNWGSSCDF